MQNLDSRVALVTGGSQGIGKAITEAFLQHKIKVLFVGLNESRGKETEKELQKKYGQKNVFFMKCDVRSKEEFEAAILTAKKSFGHLDILVNNAGIARGHWKDILDTNLAGVMTGTMLAFEHLEDKDKRKGGTVINIASITGLDHFWILPTYCATKHAVVAWTRCWSDERNYKHTGVNVCAICPGGVDTILLTNIEISTNSQDAQDFLKNTITDNTIKPSVVGEAAIQILKEEKLGSILKVTYEKGAEYVDFPRL